jgi:flavin reductase (DIM6/NTAB) family NADH-FMN oxidoreductase RutF
MTSSGLVTEKTINSRAFRNVMGLFATGVTVVAAEVDGEIHGMTANAITSVSLEPLLVLVCVQKEAHLTGVLRQAGQFSINILPEERADLSIFFAGMWKESTPPSFTFIPWIGGPRLADAIGAVACQIERFLDGGDHWIITASVLDLYQLEHPAKPLLYYRGQYRKLEENSK